MTQISYNCFVCAKECNYDEDLHSSASLQVNPIRFKICENCLSLSNPDDDYGEVRQILEIYSDLSDKKERKNIKFSEKLKDIL